MELRTSSHVHPPGVSTVPGMQTTQQAPVRWMEAEALTSFCAAEQALDPSYSHSLWVFGTRPGYTYNQES